MTLAAPTYDLMLLLDPQVEEAARAKIVTDARGAIESQGQLLRHDEWGERALAYPIERKASAEYHLLQFHPGGAELLGALNRSLRITDGILRFRIIKLKPGVPDPPDMRGAAPAAPAARRTETEPQAEPAAEAQAESGPDTQPPAEMAVGEPA